jgi:hypothetical protein
MSFERELRPAYRTLNEPSRLLGLSGGGWLTVVVAGALAYGWLELSPLTWRANLSVVVVGLGAPSALLLLREASTVTPGRLLLAVLRWRTRSSMIVAHSDGRAVRRGAVRLDVAAEPWATVDTDSETWWPDREDAR